MSNYMQFQDATSLQIRSMQPVYLETLSSCFDQVSPSLENVVLDLSACFAGRQPILESIPSFFIHIGRHIRSVTCVRIVPKRPLSWWSEPGQSVFTQSLRGWTSLTKLSLKGSVADESTFGYNICQLINDQNCGIRELKIFFFSRNTSNNRCIC